ncbi:MAG: NERD domain-containing protein [Eubacteriales bacterium]
MGLFDKIKNATFMNESTTIQYDLEELKEILPLASGKDKTTIEQAIKNLEFGQKGEGAIIYELKHSGIPMMVIQDLYLEYEDLSAQIDFLIITRDKHFVVECKNMYGDVVVENTGDFIRKFGKDSRKIYSPITQCERHLQVIKAIRKESKRNIVLKHFFEKNFENQYIPIVIMANPNGKINVKYAPKDIKHKIIGVDQLIRFIKNSNTSKEQSSEKIMESIAQFFLEKGTQNPRHYMEQYRKLVPPAPEDTKPLVESDASESVTQELQSEEGKLCSRCGGTMVKRIAKRGEHTGNTFFGCSNYPKCRYTEAVE